MNYTIQSGDNLWNIVKKQYGLTNNTEIANKVNEIAKANGLKTPNSIFVGSTLKIDVETKSSQADVAVADSKGKQLDDWFISCSKSMNQTGEFDPNSPDFDFGGSEFTDAVKAKRSPDEINKIYRKKALETSNSFIKLYDNKDSADGNVDLNEYINKEINCFEKEYGPISDDNLKNDFKKTACAQFEIMDINADDKIDEKEYASYLYAMDGSNDIKSANGKITIKEYARVSEIAMDSIDKMTDSGKSFQELIKLSYTRLFGQKSV